MATPKPWQGAIKDAEVQVLPLRDPKRAGKSGWCASGGDLEDSPEVEIMCGGINSKGAGYAALWRQGNLMHFGFEESPSEYNDVGRALLENAVCYIAQFTEDRPIAVTPSGFVDRNYPRSRRLLRAALDSPATPAKTLGAFFVEEIQEKLLKMSVDDAKGWIRENMGFFASSAKGLLEVDEDAKGLGLAIDDASFLTKALAGEAKRAVALLARRVPEGPGPAATLEQWKAFLDADRDYLFFTETGGYAWRLDPLARKRKVPTAELRGSRRAAKR